MKHGEMWLIKGEKMIVDEEYETEIVFKARTYNQWVAKDELESMVKSGEATKIS